MTRERIIRLVAGALVLTSLALAVWFNPWWLLLATFVGLNLFQSALTRWCLLDQILRIVFHVPSDAEIACCGNPGQASKP